MLARHLRKLFPSVRKNDRPAGRPHRSKGGVLGLEYLESRDQPAPLAWAVGVSLPTPEGGIVAQPEAAGVLALGSPSTTSYTLGVTYPAWKAGVTPTVQPLDFARSSPAVGPLPNGLFVVYGGTQNGFATSAVTQYDPNTVTVSDGANNQTRSLHSMNMPRALLGGATDPGSGQSYAIGGQNNNGTPLTSVEAYNPSANTWSYVASLPQTLYSESAVADGAGHVYTFGGVGADGTISAAVYQYTIATNTWAAVAPLPVGVRDSATVLGPDGTIYVIGGTASGGTSAAVQTYNAAGNTWALATPLPAPVSSEGAAVDSLGRVEVVGGSDATGNPTGAVFVSQQLAQPDAAPVITSAAVKAAVVNTAYSYQVLTTGNPQPTYALNAAPAGMTIDPNTGKITWTPTYATEGVASVTVVASSSVGQATQTYSLAVAPQTPTGLTGVGISTSSVQLSWVASPDPNVTSYDLYRRYFVHGGKGSGGSWFTTLLATGITGNSVTISGSSASGNYIVTAVNGAGVQSAQTPPVSVSVLSPPNLWGAMTPGGSVTSGLSLNVGQTGQMYLLAYGSQPMTFSYVSGPAGVTVDHSTGLVTYTAAVADIGYPAVTFMATNSVGSSTHTYYFSVSADTPIVTVSGYGPVTYDGNSHGVTATAVGTDGVTPVAGSFSFTYNGSPTPPTDAGTYAVVTTFTSADPAYANATVNGTLTISPAAPTITLSDGPFTYDGNPHGAAATAVGVDGVTPVAGGFQFTYGGSATTPVGPGLIPLVATFTSADPNYANATVTDNMLIDSTGTVSPTLSLTDGSAVYDGNAHSDTGAAIGSDGQTPVAGTFVITYNGSTTPPTAAGSYAVVATFYSGDSTYSDSTISGTLTIAPATPTLAISPGSPVYDDTGHAAVVTAVGVDGATPVAGTWTVTYDGSTTLPVNAGTYAVVATFISADPNYQSGNVSGAFTITPATPSVWFTNLQSGNTYTGSPIAAVGTAVGVDGVTPVAGTFTYYYYDYASYNALPGPPTDVGFYWFWEMFTSSDPNYGAGWLSNNFSYAIVPAQGTVTVTGGTFTYDGSPHGVTVSAVEPDGVTPLPGTWTATYNGSSDSPTLPGTYSAVATFVSSNPDYAGGSGTATIVINKATPVFSNLSSPAVNVGTTTVTVSGHIAAGTAAPGGDAVTIVLNGVTQSVAISPSGYFSTTFNVAGLTTGTYPITYEFLGDATRFNAAGGTGFASGTLTVRAAPVVLTNPASQTVVSGSGVTFSASASGYPAPTVQWQVSTNGGSSYSNISGATSASYTIAAVTAAQNSYRYRAVFTNAVGSATTTAATLTVQYAPAVTTNPHATTVNAGQTATFTAAGSGNPTPTVQWQVSIDGGSTFTDIAGATSTTLTLINTTASQNGTVYRAVFTNSVGSATSATAVLTVRYAPIVTANPTNQSVVHGQSVSFTAAAAGNPTPTVRWQVSIDGGSTFTNISGATGTTLTLNNTSTSQNGYQYRAVFTNSLGSATTAAAVLTVT
jgi:hypothetical protein